MLRRPKPASRDAALRDPRLAARSLRRSSWRIPMQLAATLDRHPARPLCARRERRRPRLGKARRRRARSARAGARALGRRAHARAGPRRVRELFRGLGGRARRAAARPARQRIPAPGVARAARDPARSHRELWRDRAPGRTARRRARRGRRQPPQSDRDRDPVPPRDRRRRAARGLRGRPRAQALAARARGGACVQAASSKSNGPEIARLEVAPARSRASAAASI